MLALARRWAAETLSASTHHLAVREDIVSRLRDITDAAMAVPAATATSKGISHAFLSDYYRPLV